MQKLMDGYLRFRAEVFPQWKDHFHLLAESQAPKVLFITCADSRVVPSLIFQAEPGDMFLCRNAGNVVPPAGEGAGGDLATIEYAVEVLHVEHIVICGHSDCGAVRAAMRPEILSGLPLVRPWVLLVEAAQETGLALLDRTGPGTDAEFRDLVCANVVGQLANLRTLDRVAARLAAGKLEIHGWYYDILTGAVEVYVPEQRSFVAMESRIRDAAPEVKPVQAT
jgi:carbonic anhydrase